MATYYPKTSLSIRTKDNNENTKTFSVGYVNGDAPDGTLKELALKVVDLSNLALTEVYKTEQNNITNASTDTRTFTLTSTSDVFSTDDTTYQAAVANLTQGGFGFGLRVQNSGTIYSTQPIFLSTLDNYANFSELCKFIQNLLYQNINKNVVRLTKISGENHRMIFSDLMQVGIDRILMTGNDANSASFMAEIGNKIVAPPSDANYTVTYSDEGNGSITIQSKI